MKKEKVLCLSDLTVECDLGGYYRVKVDTQPDGLNEAVAWFNKEEAKRLIEFLSEAIAASEEKK